MEDKEDSTRKRSSKRGAASKTAKWEESHPLVKTISIEKHLWFFFNWVSKVRKKILRFLSTRFYLSVKRRKKFGENFDRIFTIFEPSKFFLSSFESLKFEMGVFSFKSMNHPAFASKNLESVFGFNVDNNNNDNNDNNDHTTLSTTTMTTLTTSTTTTTTITLT